MSVKKTSDGLFLAADVKKDIMGPPTFSDSPQKTITSPVFISCSLEYVAYLVRDLG